MPTIMPSKETLLAQGLSQGAMAARTARTVAEQGVDPDVAAQYAITLTNFKTWFWIYAPITGFLAVCALGLGGFFTLWGLGQLAFIVLFHHRLSVLKRSPGQRLTYGIPTSVLVVLALAWALGCLVIGVGAVFVSAMAKPHFAPPAKPVVPTTPTPV